MTFYIFSMSHNIYVFNFYFTVDKETKSFGFPKMNLDVPQPHICSLKTTEYEVLPLISFKGVCGLRQALVPAIFRDDLDLLRVKAKGASDIIRSTFAFQGSWSTQGALRFSNKGIFGRLDFIPNDNLKCAFRWKSGRSETSIAIGATWAGEITQRNSISKPFQENCLLEV